MNSILLSFLITIFAGCSTMLGVFPIYFHRKKQDVIIPVCLTFAAGVMISISLFSLIPEAIDAIRQSFVLFPAILIVSIFIVIGVLFSSFVDQKIEKKFANNQLYKLGLISVIALMFHNIPEGLAIGLACGSLFNLQGEALDSAMTSALALAIGISIQNFPEGAAVSIPLLDDGLSKPKAFLLGSFSGIVEPIFGIIAIFIASGFSMAEPFLLSVAAGAMFYVTIDELLPDSRRGNYVHYGLWSFMIGFGIMMALELI